MDINQRIILIGQMPSTAGTYYTHYIGKILDSDGAVILPETNPFNVKKIKRNYFLPYSINTSSYLRNIINFEQYLEGYKNELMNIIYKWEKTNSRNLIIRDHIWSEYSSYKTGLNQSPIISKILREQGIKYTPIFTMRDPIDSWLGSISSFQEFDKIDLDEYTKIYSKAINAWRDFHKGNLIEIKIEDFVNNKEKIKIIFKKYFNFKLSDSDFKIQIKNSELSSGASGRGSKYPTILKRKPFSYFFYKEINSNKKFLRFRENIGYKNKFKFRNFLNVFMCLVHSTYQPILNVRIKRKKLKYYLKMDKFLAFK